MVKTASWYPIILCSVPNLVRSNPSLKVRNTCLAQLVTRFPSLSPLPFVLIDYKRVDNGAKFRQRRVCPVGVDEVILREGACLGLPSRLCPNPGILCYEKDT
jgi:hypothetical protein